MSEKPIKSPHAGREEKVLSFWKEKGIFEKSLAKNKGKKEFVFYEGPPTANGRPGIHHLEARAFKDAIPRYKTMRGFHVSRKGGWDTHGLPVELQVEKQLGLKSKKEIEAYGIAAFNARSKDSVWEFVHEWEKFTDRIGYWIDLAHPYVTYKPSYIEAVWSILKHVDHNKLIYKDYKVVPWCPRCGTALSSHELAQGYKDVKDLSVTAKFQIKDGQKFAGAFILAWTTTPWTLPGNVALAVNEKIDYVLIQVKEERFILAKDRLLVIKDEYKILESFKGLDLAGLSYEPLYPFMSAVKDDKMANAFKVYCADFVTTADGTGVVHTAVMYGQEDFEVGTKVGLPKHHLVAEDGTFKAETGFLAGKFVKDPETDVLVIKDLASRGLLFSKEKYEHSYPHCWRCQTPLIYYARDSWYIAMSQLRDKLVRENEKIHWEPEHIKEGRFGEWLKEVKDWAISRERYWGTPLPIWICEACHERHVVSSVKELESKPKNEYWIMRHGFSENNELGILNGDVSKKYPLTEKGRDQVLTSAKKFKHKVDLMITSPIERARETAELTAERIGYAKNEIVVDEALREMAFGQLEGKPVKEYYHLYPDDKGYFVESELGLENHLYIKKRVGDLLYSLEQKYEGKKILLVSHAGPLWMLASAAVGNDIDETIAMRPHGGEYIDNAAIRPLPFRIIPHNEHYELDLHRPFIDEVTLTCKTCKEGKMHRVREVLDVWFDSGAMPFASGVSGYPADFISEAIDQTRGWFYTLHAIGTLMGKGHAYKNVICLGHILDSEGKKMSKSIGNVVDPWLMMEKYGADALRLWMYSVNQPGDSKNFDERSIDELVKKVFNLVSNVLSFYKLYAPAGEKGNIVAETRPKSANILDQWILIKLDELVTITADSLDAYRFFEPTRALRDFIADLSQWYLRRSRDRFKGDDGTDREAALGTTRYVLMTLAKVMAPFTPFFADYLYQELRGELESAHLADWPKAGKVGKNEKAVLDAMNKVREVSSRALEARMKAKINVRQPLAKLTVSLEPGILGQEFTDLIKDEVNIKEVIFDPKLTTDVELDTTITAELQEEGHIRELIRDIQDMRKEAGLTVSDKAVLLVDTQEAKAKEFVERNKSQLIKATLLNDVRFDPQAATLVEIGEYSLKVSLMR